MNSTMKNLVFWVALVVVAFVIWNFTQYVNTAAPIVPFSEFLTQVKDQKVSQVVITGQEIVYKDSQEVQFRTTAPIQFEGLGNLLSDSGVKIEAKEATGSPWATLIFSWAPTLLIVGFWFVFMRQMQSGGNKALSFGKSKAKLSSSAQKKVTFKDVAGVDEAKDCLLYTSPSPRDS